MNQSASNQTNQSSNEIQSSDSLDFIYCVNKDHNLCKESKSILYESICIIKIVEDLRRIFFAKRTLIKTGSMYDVVLLVREWAFQLT